MFTSIIIAVILITIICLIADTAKHGRYRRERQAKIDRYDPQYPYTVQFPDPGTSSADDVLQYIDGETRLGALKTYRKVMVEKNTPKWMIEYIDTQIDHVINLMR